ncbi:MAG: hypothetical protein AAFU79_14415, partial [Myxococcota bacterium]
MHERERFDTRFPPAAWWDPDALHRVPSGGVLSWLLRQPLLLIGLAAMLCLAAFRSPAPSGEAMDDLVPRSHREATLDEVQGTLAGLMLAQVRLERAAEAEPNPALAALILSVRDRYVSEIEALALTADVAPHDGCTWSRDTGTNSSGP